MSSQFPNIKNMSSAQRRQLVLTLPALLAGGFSAGALARAPEKRRVAIGASLPLSGPLSNYGLGLKGGITAALVAAGAGAELKVLDDGGDPQKAAANARELAKDPSVAVMVAGVGAEATAAMLPVLEEAGLPLVGATTGSGTLRSQTHRTLFHLRASHQQEAAAIVSQLDQLGLSDPIGVLYQDDALGREGLDGARIETARLGWKMADAATAADGSNLKRAVATVAAQKPPAVILVMRDKLAAAAAQELSKSGLRPVLVALSDAGTPELVQLLGPLARGFSLSQVRPHPWAGTTRLTRTYQAAVKQVPGSQISYLGLEGYMYTLVALEALRRAGAAPSRNGVIAGLEAGPIDIGDFILRFTPRERQGTRFTTLTVIGEGGRILR